MKKTISIIGIGRVGLPMALVLANEGLNVYGIDRDEKKVEKIKQGVMPFMEMGAPKLLKKYVNKSFFPTTSYQAVENSEIIILTLGTPIDENMNPVLDQINESFEKIIPYLKKNQLKTY